GEVSDQALVEAVSIIKRVADTLADLGIGELRRNILEQSAALELVIESSSTLSQEQLIAIAHRIIDIEGELDVIAANAGKSEVHAVADQAGITLSEAKTSVIRESRNGLEYAKDAIVEYIAAQWNIEHLNN